MIKIEITAVTGFEVAVRGMRNPLESWQKSDSCTDIVTGIYTIGDADKALMKSLLKAGSDNSKFMRMIIVTADITAPMYFNKQLDTYKVGTVKNSCSTMHTLHKRDITIDDFSTENICDRYIPAFESVINALNDARRFYEETGDKDYWYSMIQMLPESFNQTYTWQANYAVLRNIYHARKTHKLSEWHDFCTWIEKLPNAWLITEK